MWVKHLCNRYWTYFPYAFKFEKKADYEGKEERPSRQRMEWLKIDISFRPPAVWTKKANQLPVSRFFPEQKSRTPPRPDARRLKTGIRRDLPQSECDKLMKQLEGIQFRLGKR